MANFLVSTADPDELQRLEEEFLQREGGFEVPREGIATLEAIFRAISFEYFQNSPSALVQKILAFAESTLSGCVPLALLRDIIASVRYLQDLLRTHQEYFRSMTQELCGQDSNFQEKIMSEEYSAGQENDRLFELAQRGEMRFTRYLDSGDFHESLEISIKQFCPQAQSEKTQLPPSLHNPNFNPILNPEEKQAREDLDDSCKQSHIFYTAEAYYGDDWWKKDRGSDSSKEISKFECKANTPLNQKSIGRLVIQEIKYDLNREIELGREMKRHEEAEGGKYRRMMKDKLLSAKLKKKKKK